MKTSKFYMNAFLLAILLMGVTACSSADESVPAASEQPETQDAAEDDTESASEKTDTPSSEDSEASSEKKKESAVNENNAEQSEGNEGDKKDREPLSKYSSAQIEYARVWLQLGPNQALDGLYVRHIKAGEPLNPDDETSAGYPEDVIQLAGSRLVDGSVTYSGNGDGTINVYNVPLRWDGVYPAGEKFYKGIIEQTKLISIAPGDDEKVKALIQLLK